MEAKKDNDIGRAVSISPGAMDAMEVENPSVSVAPMPSRVNSIAPQLVSATPGVQSNSSRFDHEPTSDDRGGLLTVGSIPLGRDEANHDLSG